MSLLFRTICFSLLVVASTTYAGDQAALKQLQAEMRPLVAAGNATPIQTVLARHQIKIKTTFSNQEAYKQHPPKGVTADEWRAFVGSTFEIETDDGKISYSLYDLDNDGHRDLIVDSYMGGTGLFSQFYTFRREGNSFVSSLKIPTPGKVDFLYGIGGRGADQDGTWISVNNRTYLANRDGVYGYDSLVLRAPFSLADQLPSEGLQVDYHYRNYLTGEQIPSGGKTFKPMNKALRLTLQKTIDQIDSQSKEPLGECSANPKTDPEATDWPWFGPGHYTLDVIADFPVWLEGSCSAARLVNIKTSYLRKNRHTQNMLMYMATPNLLGETMDFDVKITRKATAIKTFTPSKENTE